MPTPRRTSREDIVRVARSILEAEGVDAVTMRAVATAVGVRPPSLYKHVGSRDELMRAIAVDVLRDLGEAMQAAVAGGPRDLAAIAAAFRRWAHANPGAFGLLFSRLPETWLAPGGDASVLDPLFDAVARLAGPAQVLEAARTAVAWASGFVAMELAGAFRLGGDVDAAFAYGIDRLSAAIALDP